jgi:ribosomal protein S3
MKKAGVIGVKVKIVKPDAKISDAFRMIPYVKEAGEVGEEITAEAPREAVNEALKAEEQGSKE